MSEPKPFYVKHMGSSEMKIVKIFNTNYTINESLEVVNVDKSVVVPGFKINGQQWFIHYHNNKPVKVSYLLLLMYVNGVFSLPYEHWSCVEVEFKDGNQDNISPDNLYPHYATAVEYTERPGFYYIPRYEQNVINEKGVVFRIKRNSEYQPYSGKGPGIDSESFYPFSRLDDTGGDERRYIHVLLALVFLELPRDYPSLVVDHINGDKYDFRIDNLRWVTSSENNRLAIYEQGLKNDTISITVLDKETGVVETFSSITLFASRLSVNVMRVINARKRYDQTFQRRWVIKDTSDERSFDDVMNTKVPVDVSRPVLAKNIFTGDIKRFDTLSKCSKQMNVGYSYLLKALGGMPKVISQDNVFKYDDDEPWVELTVHDIEKHRLGLQPSTVVYELINTETNERSVHYGSESISRLTGANKRTVQVCAKLGKKMHTKYSINVLQ